MVKVDNSEETERTIKVTLLSDKDQRSPFNFISTLEQQSIKSGEREAFRFSFQVKESGEYAAYVVV